jgi:hypothetical protein
VPKKKRCGTRVGVATPTHDNVTTSHSNITTGYDNATPALTQRTTHGLLSRSSVPSTPHHIILLLMIRLSRLENEIMMFLKELARYPEIAAQIEGFLDRVRNLGARYFHYYFSVYPVSPFTAVGGTEDITKQLVPDEVRELSDELVALEMEWKAFVEEKGLWVAFI